VSELPEGWAETSLGGVCQPSQYGWTTSATRENIGLKFLRTTDITKGAVNWDTVPYCVEEPPDVDRYQLTAGDIVISRAGSVGFSAYLDRVEPAVFASYLIRFRPHESLNGRYLGWFLKSPMYWKQIGEATSGITLANVNAKKLSAVRLPVAPVPEQDRIVAAIEEQFSRLDAGVAALERVRQNLKRMRAAVLQAAVTGSDHLMERIQENRAFDLPSGWRWRTVQDVTCLVVDGDHNPPKRTPSGIPHLTARNVKNGTLTFEGCTYVSKFDFERMRKRYDPSDGDLIVTCVGTLGETALVPLGAVFSADRNLAAIRTTGELRNDFLKLVLDAPAWQRAIHNTSGSTAQPHLYLGDLRRMRIPVPPLVEQERIVDRVHELLSHITSLGKSLKALDQRSTVARSSILTAAFSGKLVPQDPTDPPASVLLERIAAERAASSKPHATRKPRQLRLPA